LLTLLKTVSYRDAIVSSYSWIAGLRIPIGLIGWCAVRVSAKNPDQELLQWTKRLS